LNFFGYSRFGAIPNLIAIYMKDIIKDWGSIHLDTCNWYFVYSPNCMPMLKKTLSDKYDVGFMDKLASSEGNQIMDIKKKRKKKNNALRRGTLGTSSSQLDQGLLHGKDEKSHVGMK
jgi:hypothetical protein